MTTSNSPNLAQSSALADQAEANNRAEDKMKEIKPEISNKSPQSPKKSRWMWIIGLLILATGAGVGWNWWVSSRNPTQPPALALQPQASPVKLTTLKTQKIQETTEVTGNLESRRSVTLKPEVDGRVTEILVTEGSRVRQGQLLFKLDSDDLQAELNQAKARLESARAKLAELQAGSRIEDIAQARAQLQEAQARLKNAQKGSHPELIAQAQAQLDSAKAEADLAMARVNRYQTLQTEGAISLDQYEELQQLSRTAIAKVQEAERRLAEVKKTRQSDIDELEASVEQSKQNLVRIENGARKEEIDQAKAEVAQNVAAVKTAQVELNKTRVLAPLEGVVGDIPIKLGDYVSEGDELTTLTENRVLEVNLSIPLEKAQKLKLGLPVEILNPQGEAIARGQITFIAPQVNTGSQLVLAKASVPNEGGTLLNLQFVQGRIIWDENQGILVPSAAISSIGAQSFVFVAQSEPSSKTPSNPPKLIVKQRQVKLGALQGNDYQVLEGLKPGEKIVTAGILSLRDGSPIIPLP